jgi:Arc/MetJ family transcription regulator
MFLLMRTTIDIQDDLLVELKRAAAESNRTLKELVEDAIRAALVLRRSGQGAMRASPAFDGVIRWISEESDPHPYDRRTFWVFSRFSCTSTQR